MPDSWGGTQAPELYDEFVICKLATTETESTGQLSCPTFGKTCMKTDTWACLQVAFEGVIPPMPSARSTSPQHSTAAWPVSLQDTDNEPAMARALSLVLSKCGLARSGQKEPLNPAAAAEAAASALELSEKDASALGALATVSLRCSHSILVHLHSASRDVRQNCAAYSSAACSLIKYHL